MNREVQVRICERLGVNSPGRLGVMSNRDPYSAEVAWSERAYAQHVQGSIAEKWCSFRANARRGRSLWYLLCSAATPGHPIRARSGMETDEEVALIACRPK